MWLHAGEPLRKSSIHLERFGLIGVNRRLALKPWQRHEAMDIDTVLVHVPVDKRTTNKRNMSNAARAQDGHKKKPRQSAYCEM